MCHGSGMREYNSMLISMTPPLLARRIHIPCVHPLAYRSRRLSARRTAEPRRTGQCAPHRRSARQSREQECRVFHAVLPAVAVGRLGRNKRVRFSRTSLVHCRSRQRTLREHSCIERRVLPLLLLPQYTHITYYIYAHICTHHNQMTTSSTTRLPQTSERPRQAHHPPRAARSTDFRAGGSRKDVNRTWVCENGVALKPLVNGKIAVHERSRLQANMRTESL